MLDVLVADWRHMTATWDAGRAHVLVRGALGCLMYPSLSAVLMFRLSHVAYAHVLTRWLAQLLKARSIRRNSVEIHPAATIGPGFALIHGLGVVVGHEVVAGRDLVLYQGVTLGHTGKPGGGQPRIGDGVRIGAGAKVLGPVFIGDGAIIGANAVVLGDVPPGRTVTGVWR